MGKKPLLKIEKREGLRGTSRTEIQEELARYGRCGLTGEDIALLLLKQQGACVGCGSSFSEVDFVIDHDHETGKVRGLLCGKCSIVLARWMTPAKLRRLARYLADA